MDSLCVADTFVRRTSQAHRSRGTGASTMDGRSLQCTQGACPHRDRQYWGDLDTHGFRILDQLRAVHPHVVSVLMDQATRLAHREAWGRESAPSRAELARLSRKESALYRALGGDLYGPAVRLEQELIGWN